MIRAGVAEAVRLVQRQIRWKPGSAIRHLRKRIRRGHLTADATLVEYEQIILSVISNPVASVYLYVFDSVIYVAVVADTEKQTWLIMFDLDGLLESAFIVERPDSYLNNAVFDKLGTVEEVLS